jgi:O-acetyl-ADP-ribose deacetylase (regulator of RNase III)
MSDREVGRERTSSTRHSWTNPSVRKLLEATKASDPIDAITERARRVVLGAIDAGWSGPPFDPLRLADHLGLRVLPRDDVRDARTVPDVGVSSRIEFNPNRPRGRVRYSIAHEIAHTFFPDCAEQIRNRSRHDEIAGDEWQLEAMCNIGAAEILMPFGSLPDVRKLALTMESMLALREQFDVSMEALLIRIARSSERPLAMFCASRLEVGRLADRYRVDYSIPSPTWREAPRWRGVLPESTALSGCTAIGFTTTSRESWSPDGPRMQVDALAIPSYPGSKFPRVVGLAKRLDERTSTPSAPVTFVRGDALEPRGSGKRFLVHVVNDKTPNWGGGGFAQAVKRRWPRAQGEFRRWVEENQRALTLGKTHLVNVGEGISIASVVAQKGYGPSATPRVRYAALRQGLEAVAESAKNAGASLHMPRIGAGQGGGSWVIIEDLIQSVCAAAGLSVTIYDLPDAPLPPRIPDQSGFSFP